MKKKFLIVGGSSGVGLELAKHYASIGHHVTITGRTRPELDGVDFQNFCVTDDAARLAQDTDRLVAQVEHVHTLIYCAGFLQRGHIDRLDDADLFAMTNVGLLAPMMLVQRLKRRSDWPLKVMLVTSSSQFTPREREPAYCATKAGLGMFGASLARDQALGKVLVVAPSGIDTPFWSGADEQVQTMLDPHWVSQKIVELSGGHFKYKCAKLMRNPARVDVLECLANDMSPIAPS